MLKAGKPTTAKDRAIAAVQKIDTAPEQVKPKTKRFNADLPEELHRAMKARAATEGVALNELTIKLFNEYLSKASNK